MLRQSRPLWLVSIPEHQLGRFMVPARDIRIGSTLAGVAVEHVIRGCFWELGIPQSLRFRRELTALTRVERVVLDDVV